MRCKTLDEHAGASKVGAERLAAAAERGTDPASAAPIVYAMKTPSDTHQWLALHLADPDATRTFSAGCTVSASQRCADHGVRVGD